MQISGVLTDVSVILPSAAGGGGFNSKHFLSTTDPKSSLSLTASRCCPSYSLRTLGIGSDQRRGCFTVKASEASSGNLLPIAPAQLHSSVGQFLAQMLQSHPHLLPAAIDQQLENLQSERDAEKEKTPPSALDVLLYKRIAEVKEKERSKSVEDILYCLVVHKFIDNQISMIPKIASTYPAGRVDDWPNQEEKLESMHSPEAFEMIINHLTLVLGVRAMGPRDTMVQISKVKLGKLYAASIMYGYFLRRVDERYQLEKSMNTLPEEFTKGQWNIQVPNPGKQLWDPESLIVIPPDNDDEGEPMDYESEDKSYRLKSYVAYLDAETLQRYATIRSVEAISLIEKQTQALFGRPDIRVAEDGTLNAPNDEVVSLAFSGLTMLVLEAVTFGSFLWDAEGDEQWLNTHRLNRESVFDYFTLSPFYDSECNNEELHKRSIDAFDIPHLSKMTGTEYRLTEIWQPNLFVIRKQKRYGPKNASPVLTFYVMDGSIYQASRISCDAFSANLERALYQVSRAFNSAISKLDDIKWDVSEHKVALLEPKMRKKNLGFKKIKPYVDSITDQGPAKRMKLYS